MSACRQWFAQHDIAITFEHIVGVNENYFTANVTRAHVDGTLYIYEDEAGVMVGDSDWRMFERPDFASDSELIEAMVGEIERLFG